jgi:hypothetical protein
VVIGWVLGVHLGVARAQSGADKAAADTLFNEGKMRVAKGDNAAACALFEASLAKVIQLGTQLALATCYEVIGKTASSWGGYRAAASTASRAHDKRQRFAEERAASLEARLSKIVIKLEPGYRIDALRVLRDGADVSQAELGTAVPVDPGDHTVEASAPGWAAWKTTVTVAPAPGTIEVVIPALGKPPVRDDDVKIQPTANVVADVAFEPRRTPTRRLFAYGIGGGGIAMVGVSLIFGGVASSRWSDSEAHCINKRCDAAGVDLAHGAATMGNLSTATFIIGTAAIATGVALYLTTPTSNRERVRGDATAWRIAPGIGSTHAELALKGGF